MHQRIENRIMRLFVEQFGIFKSGQFVAIILGADRPLEAFSGWGTVAKSALSYISTKFYVEYQEILQRNASRT